MKKTYKITLPKGAKVCTIDAKADDGVLNVTVNLEQKYVPKDGDVVCCMMELMGRRAPQDYSAIFGH